MNSLRLFSICILMSVSASVSTASLGGKVTAKDAKLSVSSSSMAQKTGVVDKFSTYEYEQNGNTVKEFSSADGTVFAVSWRGISKPDLNALFGSYLTEYQEAFESAPKQFGAKNVSLKTSTMVIRRGARMRDQRGFVFIPSLVPEGVDVEQLK